MASWILVPALTSLRDEFNKLAPNRDKASDGSIGDPRHAASSSDHNPDETGNTPYEDSDNINEVHAIDVDADLRKSGWSMQKCVDIIVERHREGRDNRLQNVIYNRRIWSRSWGWTAREYTGSNPHDKHAHFSNRYTTAQEKDTRPWGLLNPEAKPPREVTRMEFKVKVPVLEEGDRDDKREGYDLILRIQRVVKVKDDGWWGKKTTSAIAAFCKLPEAKSKVLTEDIYRKLFAAER